MLARGGSAVDAAVAANAVMGVVSPMMCGIGGDLFAIVYDAKHDRLHGLNASGWSPSGLTLTLARDSGAKDMIETGIHTVTVPGAVDGWRLLLDRFGRKELDELLQPAVRIATDGFPVTELVGAYWLAAESKLRATPNARKTFLLDDRVPRVGEVFRNPDLAWSYRQLATRGPRAFYQGEIAERIVSFAKARNGVMTRDDLREFSADWVEPISTGYRGWTVHEIPPNGQGIAALAMLNLMERFPLGEQGHNSVDALHVMIEAKKLAYADMLRHVADPRFNQVPVSGILSKNYARRRAESIALDRANRNVTAGTPPRAAPDTTYLSVVDREGNMVSLIQSIYYSFGSGLVADGCGFALQNRGGLFSLDPNHPNVVAPRKRPLHTIIPGFLEKGEVKIAFGIMGGWNQSQAHAQFVANIVDHGFNLQAAMEAPRFTKQSFAGCDVQLERRIPKVVRDGLSAKGHEVEAIAAYSQSVGGGQAVMRDFASGVNYGASDPRKDGAAIPEPVWTRSRD